MRKQRTLVLGRRGVEPGDLLHSAGRVYLVVDVEEKRKYDHALCDVYNRSEANEAKRASPDGTEWTLRSA